MTEGLLMTVLENAFGPDEEPTDVPKVRQMLEQVAAGDHEKTLKYVVTDKAVEYMMKKADHSWGTDQGMEDAMAAWFLANYPGMTRRKTEGWKKWWMRVGVDIPWMEGFTETYTLRSLRLVLKLRRCPRRSRPQS